MAAHRHGARRGSCRGRGQPPAWPSCCCVPQGALEQRGIHGHSQRHRAKRAEVPSSYTSPPQKSFKTQEWMSRSKTSALCHGEPLSLLPRRQRRNTEPALRLLQLQGWYRNLAIKHT